MSFDQSAQTGGVKFYLKDLSTPGALQTSTRNHTITSLHNAVGYFGIGAASEYSSHWGRTIDNVRLSGSVLTQSELLISAGPGMGKSTLTAALLDKDYDFLSEIALIYPHKLLESSFFLRVLLFSLLPLSTCLSI